MKRPAICEGCSLNPSHPKHNPELSGDFIPPKGPLSADILFVGMSGGEEEEEKGEPFVGPSGRKLAVTVYAMADGRKLSIRKMNLVNCRTKKRGLSKDFINRDPTAKEIKECTRRWLLPEIISHPPKLLVPLGNLAYEFLTFFTPERKGDIWNPSKGLSKGGKLPGGFSGTFQQGIGHRIRIPLSLYEELVGKLTPKKGKKK